MPPKGSNAVAPLKLPPLPRLRIRRPNRMETNPCMTAMSAVLGCWASTAHNLQACAALEQQLRACMDAPRPTNKQRNTINYHLAKFGPKMSGATKKK